MRHFLFTLKLVFLIKLEWPTIKIVNYKIRTKISQFVGIIHQRKKLIYNENNIILLSPINNKMKHKKNILYNFVFVISLFTQKTKSEGLSDERGQYVIAQLFAVIKSYLDKVTALPLPRQNGKLRPETFLQFPYLINSSLHLQFLVTDENNNWVCYKPQKDSFFVVILL